MPPEAEPEEVYSISVGSTIFAVWSQQLVLIWTLNKTKTIETLGHSKN